MVRNKRVELTFLGSSMEKVTLEARVKKNWFIDMVPLSTYGEIMKPTEILRKGWRASINIRDTRIRKSPSLDTGFISFHPVETSKIDIGD